MVEASERLIRLLRIDTAHPATTIHRLVLLRSNNITVPIDSSTPATMFSIVMAISPVHAPDPVSSVGSLIIAASPKAMRRPPTTFAKPPSPERTAAMTPVAALGDVLGAGVSG